MNEQVEILMAKVLAGEASVRESDELRALLARDPELNAEFGRLRQTSDLLRDAAPISRELDRAVEEKLPAERQRELTEALAARFSKGSSPRRAYNPFRQFYLRPIWTGALCSLLILGLLALVASRKRGASGAQPIAYALLEQGHATINHPERFVTSVESLKAGDRLIVPQNARVRLVTASGVRTVDGPAEVVANAALSAAAGSSGIGFSSELRSALFASANVLGDSGLLVTTRDASGIRVYSPAGATASLKPIFLWKSQPRKAYDLTVVDALDPGISWSKKSVFSPLSFSELGAGSLAPQHLYQLRIALSGEPLTTSTLTFRTTAEAHVGAPSSDLAKLIDALAALSGGSGRTGDALANLFMLSEAVGSSDFVKRLKLLAFGQLGYRQEFESSIAQLRQ